MKGNTDLLNEEPDAKDFNDHLREAKETDLSEIERTGCVSHGRDLKNNHLIVMIPSLGFKNNERPEHIFRKMLLLFIRKANEMVGDAYSIVYAHTSIDIINQYPLIYKFYSILPRSYKKNLHKMYIIHPNYGIKMFFEFARVFLSHKFYSKLCLLESIYDFQRVIPPTMLSLPLKFLRKEDEDRNLKYYGQMTPLSESFDAKIGTTKIIDVCSSFIRLNGGMTQAGIFRIPGDEGELSLAKVRLQYSSHSPSGGRILLSENADYILIGDIEGLSRGKAAGALPPTVAADGAAAKAADGDGGGGGDANSANENAASSLPAEAPTSIVVIRNMNTVAQIFKLSIRDLPEALIPFDSYTQLISVTRRHETAGLGADWEAAVSEIIAALPHQHISTLVYVIKFLREVVQERAANSMDSSNIATIFAPTVFRPDMVDPMRAIMEVRLSQRIIREIIDRRAILYEAVRAFQSRQFTVTENPLLSRAALQLLRPEQNAPPAPPPRPAALSQMSKEKELGRLSDEMAQLRLAVPPVERPSVAARMEEITHSLSPTMMGRMVGRSGGRDSVPVSRAAARAIEEAEEKTSSRGINRTQLSESADNVSDLSKDSLTAN